MTKIRKIAAGEFKAKCLQLMDSVQKTKLPIVITKHGKPVAKLVPLDAESPDFFGCRKDSVQVIGDIISPIDIEREANV